MDIVVRHILLITVITASVSCATNLAWVQPEMVEYDSYRDAQLNYAEIGDEVYYQTQYERREAIKLHHPVGSENVCYFPDLILGAYRENEHYKYFFAREVYEPRFGRSLSIGGLRLDKKTFDLKLFCDSMLHVYDLPKKPKFLHDSLKQETKYARVIRFSGVAKDKLVFTYVHHGKGEGVVKKKIELSYPNQNYFLIDGVKVIVIKVSEEGGVHFVIEQN